MAQSIRLTYKPVTIRALDDPSVEPRPFDYMFWSVLNIIFCNWIFGSIALVFSIKTRRKVRENLLVEAKSHSNKAFVFNMVSSVMIIICLLIIIGYLFYELFEI
jgi:hypothetical protein